MLNCRLIPVLLLKGNGLVKGVQFKKHRYIGDPLNAVRIFNEKEVDELVFLDISVTDEDREPNLEMISDIAGEAFMPLAYGGGITSTRQAEKIFSLGIEKIIINTAAFLSPKLVSDLSKISGSQSVVVSVDVRKSLFGKDEVYVNNGRTKTKISPVEYAKRMQDLGAGELIVSSIDRDGTGKGYDIAMLKGVVDAVQILLLG